MCNSYSGGHKLCNGILLLVLGVLFLLGTTGVWPEFTFVKYWPVVLILVGLHKVVCPSVKSDAKESGHGDCCK